MEVVDNQSTEVTTDNLDPQAPDTSSPDSTQQTEEVQTEKPYVPFAAGKEKFKVNGTEVEWDWETTKKYAQLGNSAYRKMEEASALQKKAADTYKQLLHLAESDPEGLIRILNPKFNPQAKGQLGDLSQEQTSQDPQNKGPDPRDQRIAELEKKFEQQEIEHERKLIQQELDASVKKYPILSKKASQTYLRAQYADALKKGLDVTMEDVAFYVAQELQEEAALETQTKRKTIEENKKRAPVTSTPGSAGESKKPMSFDDVKKLGGLL